MEGQGPLTRRFLADTMLGKLARWLRLLGFDVVCHSLSGDRDIDACEEEGRIPVTRSQRWCGHKGVVCITANEAPAQLRELLLKLEIEPEEIQFLSRCVVCNVRLERVSRSLCYGLVPDYVFETNLTFSRCVGCGKVYWRGSHPARMVGRLLGLVEGTRLEGWVPRTAGEAEMEVREC
ncbi:MAG: Mut7-C RNAse domain-containing protein [Syntrophobacteraceae bacterium]